MHIPNMYASSNSFNIIIAVKGEPLTAVDFDADEFACLGEVRFFAFL